MDIRDILVVPLVLIFVYILAYLIRNRYTDINTKKYFIPALTLKIIGAISVGLIYYYYYGYGDTMNYHTYGSRYIWEAFKDSPLKGIGLLFADGTYKPDTFEYATKIRFYQDSDAYMVVRISGFFDIITFSSYGGTSVLFAALSFTGTWALFQVFYLRFKEYHKSLAIALLFVPSVFFWGSGILKDTITLMALGWATYSVSQILLKRGNLIGNVILGIFACYLIYVIKIYILICFIPAVIIWIYIENIKRISSKVVKAIVAPILLFITVFGGYWSVNKVVEDNSQYSIDNIAKTAQITAYDIAYWTGRGAGSTYSLGELDGSFESMIKLLPQAVNVALFRPYFWEVKNPFMLMAAIESFLILILTLIVLYKTRIIKIIKISPPIIIFCLIFSLTFAFAVGVSTFNFGTLMRYKIPLMPYYISSMIILLKLISKKASRDISSLP